MDKKVQAEIYDGFHCVHCGSKNPEPWIKDRKGKKEPYPLAVTEHVAAFLASELLVPVEKLGTPPVRQVVAGPRKAGPSKAARCAIDWAIQEFAGAIYAGHTWSALLNPWWWLAAVEGSAEWTAFSTGVVSLFDAALPSMGAAQ